MRRLLLAIVFLVALAIAAMAFAPASLVDGRLVDATAGKLRLADAGGTIWAGRGAITDAVGTWRVPVAWRIDPLDVLRGTHAVTLVPPSGASAPRGVVTVRDTGFDVRDLVLDLPAAAMATALPQRLVAFGGTVAVNAPAFTFAPAAPSGTLEARWTGARLAGMGAVADLGTVRLALAPRGTTLAGTLANEGGDLALDGTVTYAAPALAIEATLTPGPQTPPAIARLLAVAGTPDSAGRVRIAWRGNVR